MRPKDELKKWITDTKKEVLDSENNYMFFLVPPDTVESILVILDEFMKRLQGEWHPLKWEDEETKCKILDYPYDGKWVIVTDGKNISVERIKIDAIDHFYPAGRWFELKDVVAWMPLPEPYKEEGDEE